MRLDLITDPVNVNTPLLYQMFLDLPVSESDKRGEAEDRVEGVIDPLVLFKFEFLAERGVEQRRDLAHLLVVGLRRVFHLWKRPVLHEVSVIVVR